MRSEYKRDVHNNYLILENDKMVEETSYPVRMLLANTLPLFLKCCLQRMDGKMLFYYEITSRQSLADFYEKKKFSYEDLQLVFGNFIQLIEKMAEYLLNPDQLVLQPEFIFLDAEKKNMYFCYLPGYEKPIREQFQTLTEYVLPKLDHEDSRAVMMGYGIYRRALEDLFQLEHIKEEVYRVQEKEQKEEIKENTSVFHLNELEGVASKSAETNDGEEEHILTLEERKEFFGDTEDDNIPLWRRILVFVLGCMLSASILLLIILAESKGYIPQIKTEMMIAGFILFLSLFSIAGYLFQKVEERKRKSACYMKDLHREGKKNTTSAINRVKESNDREYNEKVPGEKRKSDIEEKRKNVGFLNERKNPVNYGETVILSEEPVKGPAMLVSKEPGELATIYLQEDLTVIGKMENAADAVIELSTVSRVHAKIRKKGEDYYLSDLNSRNGTAVNGRMLKVDEEYLLKEEDEVDFAQARYIFLK